MTNHRKLIKNCKNSIQRFVRSKEEFENFSSFEDWYISKSEINEKNANKEIQHLDSIKKYFDFEFRKNDCYISSSGLDQIIFYCIKNSTFENFITDVFNEVQINSLSDKSVVVFPIHNFGFQFFGIKNIFNLSLTSLEYEDFQISTQTNSYEKTRELINSFCNKHLSKEIDTSDLQHFYLSRSLKWLEKNPLLLFSFNFSQLNPFENQAIILEKLAHITNQLYFISVLRSDNSDIGKLFSTKMTNNWETLDLKHFLTINGFNQTILCKPIHYKYDLLFNEMHLNIDLLAKTKKIVKWEKEAIKCLDVIFQGNKNYLLTGEIKFKIYHKISNSLKFFRRSVKAINGEDKIININIAIEALLLDNEGDKVAKIFERLTKSLKYYRNKAKSLEQVDKVIKERNNIVHNAQYNNVGIDFIVIYRMYCKVVNFITDNILEIDNSKSNKMNLFYESK
tara:strand:- start:178 stop:1530 length:1353 start_codon:yes stop_codon:yes gene_type:complete